LRKFGFNEIDGLGDFFVFIELNEIVTKLGLSNFKISIDYISSLSFNICD